VKQADPGGKPQAKPPTARQLEGRAGEDRALAYLQGHGLILVERNFRCRQGEIDLVMRQGEALVFVEVRKRADRRFGGASASVNAAKQARISAAATFYLQRFAQPPVCRIDVVAIDGAELEWIPDAFGT
jgi:putative endonuclease